MDFSQSGFIIDSTVKRGGRSNCSVFVGVQDKVTRKRCNKRWGKLTLRTFTGTYTTLTHTPRPKIIRVVNLIVAYQIAIRSLNHKNGKMALFKP
jgi:hypothetical protein